MEPSDQASGADIVEQRRPTEDDVDAGRPPDSSEVNPADAAEQIRPVEPDDDYPHAAERDEP